MRFYYIRNKEEKYYYEQVILKQKYKLNETRVIKKFLFFPLTLDGETRWLEVAKIKQKVKQYIWGDVSFSYTYGWVNDSWENE